MAVVELKAQASKELLRLQAEMENAKRAFEMRAADIRSRKEVLERLSKIRRMSKEDVLIAERTRARDIAATQDTASSVGVLMCGVRDIVAKKMEEAEEKARIKKKQADAVEAARLRRKSLRTAASTPSSKKRGFVSCVAKKGLEKNRVWECVRVCTCMCVTCLSLWVCVRE